MNPYVKKGFFCEILLDKKRRNRYFTPFEMLEVCLVFRTAMTSPKIVFQRPRSNSTEFRKTLKV